jgi:hypothetical protein
VVGMHLRRGEGVWFGRLRGGAGGEEESAKDLQFPHPASSRRTGQPHDIENQNAHEIHLWQSVERCANRQLS